MTFTALVVWPVFVSEVWIAVRMLRSVEKGLTHRRWPSKFHESNICLLSEEATIDAITNIQRKVVKQERDLMKIADIGRCNVMGCVNLIKGCLALKTPEVQLRQGAVCAQRLCKP